MKHHIMRSDCVVDSQPEGFLTLLGLVQVAAALHLEPLHFLQLALLQLLLLLLLQPEFKRLLGVTALLLCSSTHTDTHTITLTHHSHTLHTITRCCYNKEV